MTPDRFYYKAIQAYNKAKIEGPSNKTRKIVLLDSTYSYLYAMYVDKVIIHYRHIYIISLKHSYLWKREAKINVDLKKPSFINLLDINIL